MNMPSVIISAANQNGDHPNKTVVDQSYRFLAMERVSDSEWFLATTKLAQDEQGQFTKVGTLHAALPHPECPEPLPPKYKPSAFKPKRSHLKVVK